MKKKLSILLTLASAAFAIISITGTSIAADPIKLPSIFTPTRSGINFSGDGLTYPSFNNFTSNPNIAEGGRQGDERAFTLGKLQCRDGGTTCTKCTENPNDPYCNYYDTLGVGAGEQLEAGDKIRFEVYFHNNGSDSYDSNTSKNSETAKNVDIGINVTDISRESTDPVNTIRPVGYIKADNNQYYNLTGSYLSQNGIRGIEIQDDMQAFIDPSLTNVSMEIVPGSAILKMLTSGTNENQKYDFLQQISENTSIPITFSTDQGDKTISVKGYSSSDKKKIWINFNELPGCFRYSGLVYFDAIIKGNPTPPANVCTSLSFINFMDPLSGEAAELTCTVEQKLAWFKMDVNFSNLPEPSTQKIKFLSSDRKATISLPPYDSIDGELIPATGLIKEFSASDFNTEDELNSIIGLYYGTGDLSAVYLDENGAEQTQCQKALETCANECNYLCLSKPSQILPGTFSDFNATTSDYYGDDWSKNVTYEVQEGYGLFYKKQDYNGDGAVNDLDISYQIKQDFPESNPVKNTSPTTPCSKIDFSLLRNVDSVTLTDSITTILSGGVSNKEDFYREIIPGHIGVDKEYRINPLKNQPAAMPQSFTPSTYGMNNVLFALVPQATKFGNNVSNLATPVINPAVSLRTFAGSSTDDGAMAMYGNGVSQLIVPQEESVWFYAIKPGTNIITVISENDTDNLNCTKQASIQVPPLPLCGDLTLTFANGAKTAYVGATNELLLKVTKAGSNELYPSTVLFKDLTGGGVVFPRFTTVTQSAPDALTGMITYTTIYPYPAGQIFTMNSKKAGTIRAEVQGEESICSDEVSLIENVCNYITVRAWATNGTLYQNPTSLNGGEIYKMQSTAAFASTTPANTQINYNADNVFTGSPIPFGYFAKETTVNIAGLDITIPNPDLNTWSSNLTVPQTEFVYFFANPQLTPFTYNSAIRVSVVGTTVPGCEKAINLVIPAKDKCTSIVLKTDPTPFDPKTKTKITIDPTLSLFGDYDGNFTFAITSGQESANLFITENAENGGKSLTISKAQATTTGVYLLATDGRSVTVEVYATDPAQVGCKAILTSAICRQLTLGYDEAEFIPSLVTSVWVEDNPTDLGGYTGDFVFEVTQGDNAYFFTDTQTDKKIITVSYAEAISGVGFKGILETTRIRVYAVGAVNCIGVAAYTYNPAEECQDLFITTPDEEWEVNRGDNENFEIKVVPFDHDWVIDWEITDGNGYFKNKEKKESTTEYTNRVYDVREGTRVYVYVRGHEEACNDFRIADEDNGTSTSTPPKLTKKVIKGDLDNDEIDRKNMKWKDDLNMSSASAKGETISYQVYFKSGKGKGVNSVEIWDDSINDGEIESEKPLKKLTGGNIEKGSLKFSKLVIDIDDKEISDSEICGNEDHQGNDTCVTSGKNTKEDFGDIKNAFENKEKLEFKNLKSNTDIRIYYEMEVDTNLDTDTCKILDPRTGCGEEFVNEARYKTNVNKYDGKATTSIIITCPYIITRSGGDSYFGSDLKTGTDISYCGPQKNISGPIIKAVKNNETIVKSGATATTNSEELKEFLLSPTHDVCKFSNTGENLSGYQNALSNFSSSICEMETEVSSKWNIADVQKQIVSNAERVGRFATQVKTGTWPSGSPSQQARIYNFTNGLTIDDTKTISGTHTYIIKGDLKINGNITYEDSIDYSNANNVPSAAFIVIGGNIIVAEEVEQMDGIYIVIPTTNATGAVNDGKFISDASENKLIINGGLYGDVTELFSNRTYVGDLSDDEGSVTIRYSENFIINTPPGLNDLMDITQLKTPY